MKPKQFQDFKTVKDKVRFLLQTNPALRDNDMKLIATYYFHEIGKEEIDSLNAYDLLTKISSSKMTNFETIRRLRMQIQQHDETLRGSEYKTRKKRIDPAFRVFLRE
jgi:hypothetical protein